MSYHYDEHKMTKQIKKSLYTTLGSTYTSEKHPCSKKNDYYPAFHGGINCICCVKQQRSVMDLEMLKKEQNNK